MPTQPNDSSAHLRPVNAFSSTVDPRKLFPTHFDGLMRGLYAGGQEPERWRVLDAQEYRLDEDGQEVDFTLVQNGTDLVWRLRVVVSHGTVVKIDAIS
jgi:hypothetical protein